MTREEHRDIIAFICDTVRQDENAGSPIDVEADAIIRALFVRNPEAAYRVTQLALAQRDELGRLKLELADANMRSSRNWLAWLLQTPRSQRPRLDPTLSLSPQNLRGR